MSRQPAHKVDGLLGEARGLHEAGAVQDERFWLQRLSQHSWQKAFMPTGPRDRSERSRQRWREWRGQRQVPGLHLLGLIGINWDQLGLIGIHGINWITCAAALKADGLDRVAVPRAAPSGDAWAAGR
eukprot:SAG31_NODE_405_length_16084_cov_3.913982_2_plen_127_part_00